MDAKIAVFGILRFPPDKVAGVLPHLKALVAATYATDGCIAYDVAEDPFDPGLFRFSELWPDAESLSRHLQAPHIEPWRNAARAHGLIERRFTAFDVSGARPV
jgi:quinol monooxygenase YgiN